MKPASHNLGISLNRSIAEQSRAEQSRAAAPLNKIVGMNLGKSPGIK